VTPERWEQIGRLYEAASELPAESRAAFLRDACQDDHVLRKEVESLLASAGAAADFLTAGAIADAAKRLAEDSMDSVIGRSLGHYKLVSLLGSGGMGEVYRAHDARLGRDVAVKVLPALATQSDSARRRFDREARAVAALSHPNIRSLYDVGEADGRVYAVMELLDGETLRARTARGPLNARKAMEIGAAIADGLAAAHARGIVHRDLKPENVFIIAGDHVKVLDFGLAKVPEPVDAHTISETLPGVILGTAGYMSPEQVSGKEVDARSDIFAFGCVLYEMVSGRRAFERKTGAETMTAILNDEPPELAAVSGDLRRIIAHCLEKQPDTRFQSAQDLTFQLRGLLGSADARRPVSALTDGRRLWPVAAVLFLITTVALSLLYFRQAASHPQRVQFDVLPPDRATFSGLGFSLSPDGSRLAFVTSSNDMPPRRLLWVRSFDSGESQLLSGAGDVGDAPPVWSPDGQYIAFVTERKIRKIPLSGGSPQTVVEAPADGTSQVPMTWSADDVILFGHHQVLMKVSAAGGPTTSLTALDRGRSEMLHYSPRLLPDGRHFLYVRSSFADGMSGIFVGSVDEKPEHQDSKRLVATRGTVRYAPSMDDPRAGHVLFNRDGTLWAQRFDANRLELVGEPVVVAEQIGEALSPHRQGFFSISTTGALAYRRQETIASLPVWLDPDGRPGTALVETPLVGPVQLRFSPDGHRLAMIVAGDVWVYDLGGSPPIKLTSGGHSDMLLWTPDGKGIVYAGTRPDRLLSVPLDLPGATPEPVSPGGHFHPHGWLSDGRDLIVVQNTYSASGWDILRIPFHEKGEPARILATPFDEGEGGVALSPDGRWLAYTSNSMGTREIWAQPYPGPGAPIRVSPHGGVDPLWARDGRTLYYLENKRLMSVAVESSGTFTFKPPAVLFEIPELAVRFPNQSYDVAPDGRFLMVKDVSTPASAPPITVILNWTASLRR
jgi:serine/threonine protein kinase